MKKLGKLSLKQLDEQLSEILPQEMMKYLGGSGSSSGSGSGGFAEYYNRYGVLCPGDCYYNPETDQLCNIGTAGYNPGSISLTPEDAYSKACAEGYQAAFRFYAGVGIAIADLYLLFSGMPGIGPDISNLGTW